MVGMLSMYPGVASAPGHCCQQGLRDAVSATEAGPLRQGGRQAQPVQLRQRPPPQPALASSQTCSDSIVQEARQLWAKRAQGASACQNPKLPRRPFPAFLTSAPCLVQHNMLPGHHACAVQCCMRVLLQGHTSHQPAGWDRTKGIDIVIAMPVKCRLAVTVKPSYRRGRGGGLQVQGQGLQDGRQAASAAVGCKAVCSLLRVVGGHPCVDLDGGLHTGLQQGSPAQVPNLVQAPGHKEQQDRV